VQEEEFFMSNNQMMLAKTLALPADPDITPEHVYVILRVYELDYKNALTAKLRVHIDPWNLIFNGELEMRGKEGFIVTDSARAR
jgi:hypothetical protein